VISLRKGPRESDWFSLGKNYFFLFLMCEIEDGFDGAVSLFYALINIEIRA
jgi:hypothetical protein